MDSKMAEMLTYLRLSGLLERWDDYLALSRKKRFSPVRFLTHVLEEEYKLKVETARERRLKRAQIPEYLVMETYPFSLQPKLNKKRVLSLYDAFDFMVKSQNIIWLGPTGCGKTGLATSFLIQAICRGHTGRYILFPELIGQLYRSRADHTEDRVIKRFLSYDVLLIDEIGYVEAESTQVGHFFTLMHKRHKRKPTLITSNLGFDDWRPFLKNPHLTAALIDRLTDNSHVINMKECDSLRGEADKKVQKKKKKKA